MRPDLTNIPFLFKEGCSRLQGANGVVFNEFTNHPVCAERNGAILLMAQPPLLEKEGNAHAEPH